MVTQALYRRWRSQSFAEILGQNHVTHTLLNAIRAGRIAHAYLFSGPRGTGKTSTARVLAKAVNCLEPQEGEPCNQCAICRSLNEARSLDLIEVDAASNRGIDEIRELREKIAFSPSECRYKVYVIDEVHMLTNEAFNALLKTLEEPPPHAIFVLATTEPHKIPATVLSRCQRFDFRRVSVPDLKKKLQLICKGEGVSAGQAALDAIARYAAGSFRDAESLLDQLMSFGTEQIVLADVRRVLGAAPEDMVSGIVRAAISGEVTVGLDLINQALDSGVEPRQLTREVLEYLRGMLLVKNGGASLLQATPEALEALTASTQSVDQARLVSTVKIFNQALNQLKTGLHEQLPLEMAVVEAGLLARIVAAPDTEPLDQVRADSQASRRSGPGNDAGSAAKPKTVVGPEAGSHLGEEAPTVELDETVSVEQTRPRGDAQEEQAESKTDAGRHSEMNTAWLQEKWLELLQRIRSRNRMAEALLKSCEPVSIENGLVTLGFYHTFHKERVSEEQHRTAVEEALTELGQRPFRVKCVLLEGDREQRERERETSRREELLSNPVVHEAITNYGARVVDVR